MLVFMLNFEGCKLLCHCLSRIKKSLKFLTFSWSIESEVLWAWFLLSSCCSSMDAVMLSCRIVSVQNDGICHETFNLYSDRNHFTSCSACFPWRESSLRCFTLRRRWSSLGTAMLGGQFETFAKMVSVSQFLWILELCCEETLFGAVFFHN